MSFYSLLVVSLHSFLKTNKEIFQCYTKISEERSPFKKLLKKQNLLYPNYKASDLFANAQNFYSSLYQT